MVKKRGAAAAGGGSREHPYPAEATVKRLYAKALWCAKPGCGEPLYKAGTAGEKEVLNSRVAHIHARCFGGARWLEGMTSAANRGYDNLVILCLLHADAVDKCEADYPPQMLREWRAQHEAEVRELGGVKRPPMTDAQVAEVMARSFVPLLADALREVLPFSACSRTRSQALERARAESRGRSLARLAPVERSLRERVLAWAVETEVFRVAVPEGCVRVLVAPMGSGKSELAESWWSEGLSEAEADDAIEVPVWLDARAVAARGLAPALVEAIGGDPVRPCRVVLDDLDSVGAQEARFLLEQARRLVTASPHVRVLATARPGAVSIDGEGEAVAVPAWSVERGLALLDLIVGESSPQQWWAPETRPLLERPLTAAALAARLTAGGDAQVTRTRLLSDLAPLIVERGRNDAADERTWEHFARLAISILQERGAVRAASFANRPVVWGLCATGLVVENDGALAFALPLFEQYFGAEAIRAGAMPLAQAAAVEAFDRWRYAIAFAVADGTRVQAERDMAVIARANAAAASWVFDEVAPQDQHACIGDGLTDAVVRAEIETGCPELRGERDLSIAVGRWLRGPIEAMLEGFGPLRTDLAAHREGVLCRWGVRVQAGWVLLAKSRSEVVPPLVRIDDPDREVVRAAGWPRQERFALPTGELARWRWARTQVREQLVDLLQRRRLPTSRASVLTRERMWELASFVTAGRFGRDGEQIRVEVLRRELAPYMERVNSSVMFTQQWTGLRADSTDFRWLDEQLRSFEGDVLERPWPAPDLPEIFRRSYALRYTPQATARFVAGVLEAALEGYRDLVEANFGPCASSLATYRLLPARVDVLVERFEGERESAGGLQYLITPHDAASAGWRLVEVELCLSQEEAAGSGFAAMFQRGVGRIPPGSISDTSDLPMHWSRPASGYAYRWLVDDLVKVGLLEPLSVRFFN
ncbi:hypothetical protein KDL01_37235 [Actinospica durhamensis]|uniref:Uncharacterized protein n=1 Tax=Actinospica durhamensis TaxID=1508375 RepID=A0A941EYW5_9ACTN|nr:hypothetical protein [Actinospica durhamensis]MBR7838972.1 hypothetical protein [Actinospica durhamensis]